MGIYVMKKNLDKILYFYSTPLQKGSSLQREILSVCLVVCQRFFLLQIFSSFSFSVFSPLLAVVSTEGALKRPTTYDNQSHPSHPKDKKDRRDKKDKKDKTDKKD